MPQPQPHVPPSGAPRTPERPLARRRVAVIAVHGVAHHPPGETENAVADLLLSLSHDPITNTTGTRQYDAPRAYESFRGVAIQIPLQRLPVNHGQLNPVENTSGQEQSARFAQSISRRSASPTAAPAKPGAPAPAQPATLGDIGQQYTGTLLDQYEGGADKNVYTTTRLEGRRAHDLTDVDIYEVLWADLAKPYNTVVKFFIATFQLLFHLATLSRIALDTGADESHTFIGNALRLTHRFAVRIFQIYVPVTHLLLLIAVVACFSTAATPTSGHSWFPVLCGALAGIYLGYHRLVRPAASVPRNPWGWAARLLLAPAAGGALMGAVIQVLLLLLHNKTDAVNIAGALASWFIVGIVSLSIAFSFSEDARPGVTRDGWIMYAIASLGFIAALFQHQHSVMLASFWMAEIILGAIRVSWFALILTAIASSILGWLTIRQQPVASDPRARAIAAVRTSRFALALPCALFLMLTMLLWSATFALSSKLKLPNYYSAAQHQPGEVITQSLPYHLQHLGEKILLFPPPNEFLCEDSKAAAPQTPHPRIPPAIAAVHCDPGTALVTPAGADSGSELWNAFTWALGPELPISLALLSLAVFLLAAWVLPSAITERFPPRPASQPAARPPAAQAPRDTGNLLARFMGAWLSAGLDATTVITTILWCSVFLIPVLVILVTTVPGLHNVWEWFACHGKGAACIQGSHQRVLIHLTKIVVVTNAAAAVAIIAGIFRDGGSLLGIVLDVDTYLRMSPVEATPRARIFERYISTLRYIEGYRDAQGKPYESIVIFSHSLGALISGDILHFLQSPYSAEPPLQNSDIRLLTMGNPVRQLLNRFFPYLYDWISPQPDNALQPLNSPDGDPPAHLPPGHPDARKLGVTHWANAFRSGDYVGRQLWLDAWYQRTPTDTNPAIHPPTVISSPDHTRHELCIGAGAHTHYMDDTAPDIAWLLNHLINDHPTL